MAKYKHINISNKLYWRYLISPPWMTWRNHIATILIVTLSSPVYFTLIGLTNAFSLYGPVPNFSNLSHFSGKLLRTSNLNHGQNIFSSSDGVFTLECITRRCLPESALKEKNIEVTYWAKYNLLMDVYAANDNTRYIDYQKMRNKIEKLDDYGIGNRNLAYDFAEELVQNVDGKKRYFGLIYVILISLFGYLFILLNRSVKLNRYLKIIDKKREGASRDIAL